MKAFLKIVMFNNNHNNINLVNVLVMILMLNKVHSVKLKSTLQIQIIECKQKKIVIVIIVHCVVKTITKEWRF